MNISIFNWHNSSFDSTNMKIFTLFQFLTRVLNSNHFNLISSYLVGRNEEMWNRAFQLLKMQKMKVSWNIKTKCVTDFFWQLGLRVWRIILVITWWAHKRQTFILNSKKLMWFLKFFFLHVTGYLNTKETFPICVFVVMASGKCELHTYYTFLQRILISTHIKILIFFCIIYVRMSNIHYSGFDNVKMTCQTHKC